MACRLQPLFLPPPLLLLLLLLLASSAAGGFIPAAKPPARPSIPYPSFLGLAADIRNGMLYRPTSLEQLNIQHDDSTITIQGRTYQLDANGTVTVGTQRYEVSGDSVSVNGVWYHPMATTEEPRRRKPDWEPLPEYDGTPFSSVDLSTMLAVAVPTAAGLLSLLLCCLCCTHHSCWCCGVCDDRRRSFSRKLDRQYLIA